jgi:dihydroxyacetone kinase phosphoprotein-dependent L subunit
MSVDQLTLANSGYLVRDLIHTIVANREHLSELDGAIGDGDHGINMSKGFQLCETALDARGAELALPEALAALGQALLEGIGGSMGPLYGTFFHIMGESLAGSGTLDAASFHAALSSAIDAVQMVGGAQPGDKCLIDTLFPAREAYARALASDASFATCLAEMSRAAEAGRDATRGMRARIGRAARLGERSIGVVDAGAASCALILCGMAASLRAGGAGAANRVLPRDAAPATLVGAQPAISERP